MLIREAQIPGAQNRGYCGIPAAGRACLLRSSVSISITTGYCNDSVSVFDVRGSGASTWGKYWHQLNPQRCGRCLLAGACVETGEW